MSETTDVPTRRAAYASPLAAAHDDLLRRCHGAERAGDWQEAVILSALVAVADHVKRIGDNPDSAHYRAQKAGTLLTAAIRLHRDTLLAYGGWPECDASEQAMDSASRLLHDAARQAQQTMWQAMRAAQGDTGTRNRSEPATPPHVGRQLADWALHHPAGGPRDSRR